jgi:hypothetical protein
VSLAGVGVAVLLGVDGGGTADGPAPSPTIEIRFCSVTATKSVCGSTGPLEAL